METASVVSATRSGSLHIPSPSSSRNEWRAVSDPQLTGNSADHVLDRLNERTIYEHGKELADVDFCSITVDATSEGDILQQQQLHSISRQKEELQQLEIDLRVRIISRNEILEIQNNFKTRIKDHANAAAKLQEQLHEKERTIRELERKTEEKDRELHAIKLDNEAAWAKEDLLREQNRELATFRRERDHSEAERAQHIQQICELQEHIQEKERQLMELKEHNRVSQESILYRDEQLREAQAWVTRVKEMDTLHSSTNYSLHAQLRERTEQFNQLWIGCQRQFAEMERLHLHTVQQLQLQLANVREKGASSTDESLVSRSNSINASQILQNSGNQIQNNGVADVSMAPSSVHGMHAYLPPCQISPLYSLLMHQQGIHHPFQPRIVLGNSQGNHGDGRGAWPGSAVSPSSVTPQEPNGRLSPDEQNGSSNAASMVAERNLENALLDERTLLACIVRTIPAGGRIHISSTLPKRLGKMLAPLNWHDYMKKYGKLDDFVARHPELFVMEGNYIQLQEGAQKMVAASAAAPKVTAAEASSPHSMYVAVTPMPQSHGLIEPRHLWETARK